MKATVTYISASQKSAIIAVKQNFGFVNTSVSGFVEISEGANLTVGQTIDIPAAKVSKEIRTAEDGTKFEWLTFE
jgi:hypothetical protein